MDNTLSTAIEILIKAGWAVSGFFDSSELISYSNIVGFVVVVAIIWYSIERKTGTSFIACLFPAKLWQDPSAKLDIKFYILIQPLAVFIMAPLLIALMQALSYDVLAILTSLLGPMHTVPIDSSAEQAHFINNPLWAIMLYTFLVFMAKDFAFFISHYFQHKWKWLWCFHKVHHSPTVLTPFTAARFHPLDMAWNMAWGIALAAIMSGLCQYLFYNGNNELQLFGNNIIIALSYLSTHILRHSHIWLHYPHKLSRWLISPAMHQIHHSRELRHLDKNFGYLFAGWDRLFGTDYNPRTKEAFALGVDAGENNAYTKHHSVLSILWVPFAEVWKIIRK